MARAEKTGNEEEIRGQTAEANSLKEVMLETVKLWKKHHLSYDQSKHVVEQVRRELRLSAPRARRRTVERLDRFEVERLIAAAYRRSSGYGLLVKTLFYTGARVSELVNINVEDLRLDLEPRAGPIAAVLKVKLPPRASSRLPRAFGPAQWH